MRSLRTLLRLIDIFLNDALTFKHAPTAYTLKSLIREVSDSDQPRSSFRRDGVETWVPARPEGYHSLSNRIRCAWLVFTGKADAVKWPGDQ